MAGWAAVNRLIGVRVPALERKINGPIVKRLSRRPVKALAGVQLSVGSLEMLM